MRHSQDKLISAVWFGGGFLSWMLAIYILGSIFASPIEASLEGINGWRGSLLVRGIASLFMTHLPEFILCFVAAAILSFVTDSTPTRIVVFLIGATLVLLLSIAKGLFYHFQEYTTFKVLLLTSEFQLFIILLVLMPLLAFLGSQTGTFFKYKLRS